VSIKPSLQALWLADEVSPDDATGKVTVSGIFNQIEVDPGTDFTAPAHLFFALRDVHGRVELILLYVDLDDNGVLLERSVQVDGSPLLTTDVCVRISKMPVPHPGVYSWELLFGNELLGASRVQALFSGSIES
jgi:hypothetical protein